LKWLFRDQVFACQALSYLCYLFIFFNKFDNIKFNISGNQVLKEPDESGVGEYLICDVQKPGVILRLWSARIGGREEISLYEDYHTILDNYFTEPVNLRNGRNEIIFES